MLIKSHRYTQFFYIPGYIILTKTESKLTDFENQTEMDIFYNRTAALYFIIIINVGPTELSEDEDSGVGFQLILPLSTHFINMGRLWHIIVAGNAGSLGLMKPTPAGKQVIFFNIDLMYFRKKFFNDTIVENQFVDSYDPTIENSCIF